MSHNGLDLHSVYGSIPVSKILKCYGIIVIELNSRSRELSRLSPLGSRISNQRSKRFPDSKQGKLGLDKNYIFISQTSSWNSAVINDEYNKQTTVKLALPAILWVFCITLKILKTSKHYFYHYKNTVVYPPLDLIIWYIN